MKIIAYAPCRIGLVGGGTDVDPFARTHGGAILNFAINLHHHVTLEPLSDSVIRLEALGERRSFALTERPLAYGIDQKFDLLRAIINHFIGRIPSGFSLRLNSPQANPLGLGRSGSAAVAVIGAFDAWLKTALSRLEIGLLGSRLEIEELGWPGGKQDALVAAFGGVNHMTFGPGDAVGIHPIALSDPAVTAFKQRVCLVFVSGDRHSFDQQKRLINAMADRENSDAMFRLKHAVRTATAALEREDWAALGHLLHEGWEDKKKSNPSVTNDAINGFYDLALNCGAYGGKIAGSGGAGNMFFLMPPEKKQDAIRVFTDAGAVHVDFDLDFAGLTVHTYDH
jgi:D-glycero-alpha-D-manno-heptose-7-phosphate kinase